MGKATSELILSAAAISMIVTLVGRWLYDYFTGLKAPTAAEVKALADIEGRVAHIEWRTTQMEAAILSKVDKAYYDLSVETIRQLMESNQAALETVRIELQGLRQIIVERHDRDKRYLERVCQEP